MRYAPHTIRHAPEGGMTFEVFCVTHQCGAESGPPKVNRKPRRIGR